MTEPLAERLNSEPIIFKGYTDSELIAAVMASGTLCFPLGLVGGLLVGKAFMGLGAGMMATLGLVVLGASSFQDWKRGRPDYWLQQRVHILMVGYGVASGPLIRRPGVMGAGRDWYDHPDRRRRRIKAGR